VTPFKKIEREIKPDDFSASTNIEDTLKRTIPDVPTPIPAPKIQRKSKPAPRQSKKVSAPEMSAPQLAKIQPFKSRETFPSRAETPPQPSDTSLQREKQEQPPAPEKMSKMMKELMGEVKVPTLKPVPATPRSQQTMPDSSPSTKPVPSPIDQRIAKLSIPSVTPVESIKKRLQLLEVQPTSNSGNAASQSSAGTNHYYGLIQDLIQDQWRNTPLVADAPLVVLKFRIARSGKISQIRVDKSSGNGYYDSAARRAVNAVNPLPPFPSDISDPFLDVRFQFIKIDQND
jgi:TonB family protein